MQINYKRDMNHNYLILTDTQTVDTESYQIRMLVSNPPQGLLKCRLQSVDNQIQFYYDITSKQSLSTIYEYTKIKREDLNLLFGALIKAVEEMEAYLLKTDHLLLQPEYIFLDSERENGYFCFFPIISRDAVNVFREMAEYLLPKIDHTDQPAVILGYSIYRRAMEDTIYIDQIKSELYREVSQPLKKGEESLVQEETEEYLSMQDELLQSFLEADEKEEIVHPAVHSIGIAAAGMVFLGYLYFLNNSSYSWQVYAIATAFIAGAAMIPIIIYRIQKRKMKKRVKKEPIEIDYSEASKTGPGADFEQEDQDREREPEPLEHKPDLGMEGATTVLAPVKMERFPCLVAVHPVILQPILINKDILILGKLETVSDVVLPSPAVSRVHAKIMKEEGYFLYDLNSRNGTYLNNQMLNNNERCQLEDGDEITFGDLTYCFRTNI